MNTLGKYVEKLEEAERSFYVSGNKLHFTKGQEHVSIDITRHDPHDNAHDIIAKVVIANAMVDLSKRLKREPSYEELADEADDNAHGWALEAASRALHMGASDFYRVAQELFPGLAKEAPKENVDESLQEGFHVPENELKMGRIVRWYDYDKDRIMFGQVVNVTAHNVTVNDMKFNTDKTYVVVPDVIVKVMEPPKKEGAKPKVVWSRGL